MKKILQMLTALLLLVAMFSCDNNTTNTTESSTSEWWLKGSMDGWADSGDDQHFFTKDELDSNILRFEITDLYIYDYEFVIVAPDGTEWKANTDSSVASETAIVFTDVEADQTNATFTAAKTSYTVVVDITDSSAPSVKLEAGATDAVVPDFAKLAEELKIKGDMFTIGWTETAGIVDADNKTVTFEVTADSKTGTFGFSSMDGYLKCDEIASPTTAAESATAVTLTKDAANNISISDIPKSDSVYTIVVTIDESKTVAEGKYSMVVTLKTVGVTDWAFDIPVTVYLLGDLSATDWSDWSQTDDGREAIDLVSDIATYTYTTTDADDQKFKWATAADSGWDGLSGFGSATIDTSTITLSNDDGNFLFSATDATSYTIKIDYSDATDYATTGVPVLTVTAN